MLFGPSDQYALEAADRGAPLGYDPLDAQQLGDLAQGDVGGNRDDLEAGAHQHHRHQLARNAAALGDELGLARMDEADRVKLGLGDGARDEPRGGAGAGQPHRELERVERIARALEVGTARDHLGVRFDAQDRKRRLKGRDRFARIVDHRDRAVPHRPHRRDAADRKEGRHGAAAARLPAFGDDLGSDPRRIAQRDGKRHIGLLSDNR